MIRIQVRWKTGAIDDFTVPRLNQGRKTSAEIVALVQALFNDGKNDAQICQELHRRGLKTGVGAQWTVPAVQRVRYSQGFVKSPSQGRRCVSQRDDGCYSIHGIAKRFDVRPAVVRYWVQKGLLLPVEGGGTGKTQWFVLDEQTVARIEAAKANHHPANQTSNASA